MPTVELFNGVKAPFELPQLTLVNSATMAQFNICWDGSILAGHADVKQYPAEMSRQVRAMRYQIFRVVLLVGQLPKLPHKAPL